MTRSEWAFLAKQKRAERMRSELAQLERELRAEAASLGAARGIFGLRPEALKRELVG